MFSEEYIKKHLNYDIDISLYDSVTSTNEILKTRALSGAPHLSLIAACSQTAGRGRLGRNFFSPPGSGIYMSILLRPHGALEDSLCITTCSAVAMCRVIENVSAASPGIKWVNDIYTDKGKVCGILTEGGFHPDTGDFYAICGIGVNLTPPPGGFPCDIQGKAGALFDNLPDKHIPEKIISDFINTFVPMYNNISKKAFLPEYRKRSIVIGKRVKLLGKNIEATAIGINDDFSLTVKYNDGSIGSVSNGDVSILVI